MGFRHQMEWEDYLGWPNSFCMHCTTILQRGLLQRERQQKEKWAWPTRETPKYPTMSLEKHSGRTQSSWCWLMVTCLVVYCFLPFYLFVFQCNAPLSSESMNSVKSEGGFKPWTIMTCVTAKCCGTPNSLEFYIVTFKLCWNLWKLIEMRKPPKVNGNKGCTSRIEMQHESLGFVLLLLLQVPTKGGR